MKLLKIEEHYYSIVYIDDDGKYEVYKRFNEDKWQKYHNNEWKDISNIGELENIYNDFKNKK
jgi:hypothetical protein